MSYNIVLELLVDALCAGVASIGFGAISSPPYRAFRYIALLAAIGHACRFALMNYLSVDIASASFFSAVLIGLGSFVFGRLIFCPTTVLSIPAVLPMIPGKFAYNTIFGLIMFMHNVDNPTEKAKYFDMMISNGFIAASVLFLLSIGVTIPVFVFYKKAYSLTRH